MRRLELKATSRGEKGVQSISVRFSLQDSVQMAPSHRGQKRICFEAQWVSSKHIYRLGDRKRATDVKPNVLGLALAG